MSPAIPIDRYRTIGILASQDAGRTTTTERILAIAELSDAMADPMADERAITQTSGATSCDWHGHRLNLIELPALGRPVDSAAMNAIDAVVVVVDAERGVTPEVDAALAQAASRGLARLVFVNKLDRAGSDFEAIARSVAQGLPLQLPIGAGAGLAGLVDVVGMIGLLWPANADAAEHGVIPSEFQAAAAAAHQALATAVGGKDGAALGPAIREAVRAGTLVPVLCGSAFRNRGTRRLLDAIVDYLPAPSDVAHKAFAADGTEIEQQASDDASFAGLAFRTVSEPTAGRMTFLRVYAGALATGDRVFNPASRRDERVGPMIRVRAKHSETVETARAGDVVALAGLEHTSSGDTLCDPSAPVILGEFRPRSAA
ncbi:MAG TPA: GTP-binding protein [Stellaceae bacterium]|nr:GTP-binding protein [Stellaceae bacterium]